MIVIFNDYINKILTFIINKNKFMLTFVNTKYVLAKINQNPVMISKFMNLMSLNFDLTRKFVTSKIYKFSNKRITQNLDP